MGVTEYISHCSEDLIVLSDSDVVCNIDLSAVIEQHERTGADLTVVTKKMNLCGEKVLSVQRALAESIKLLNEAGPSERVLALKSLEAFGKAADGKATKIIIPSEIQSLAGLATSLKEVLTDPVEEKKPAPVQAPAAYGCVQENLPGKTSHKEKK